MRTQRTIRLGIVAAALAAFVLVGASGALADGSYSDPAGDSGAAPDITSVAVSHDDATVTFAVTTNQPVLSPDVLFAGYIDTDKNVATGFPHNGMGAEHFFIADGDGGFVAHVNGNAIVIDFQTSLTSSYANGVLTVRIARSELDSPNDLMLGFESDLSDADGNTIAEDAAPNGPPYFTYSFAPLTLAMTRPGGTPKKPVAGKAFVVTSVVTRSDAEAVSSGQLTCQAKAGKQTLRSTGSLTGGSARCAMRVPKGAKGKVLRGSLTAKVEDATVTKAFKFTVR
jgi:hypothetical protein